MNKIAFKAVAWLLSIAFVCSSCSNGGEDNSGNELPLPSPEVVYTNANLVYYGISDDVDISSFYRLTLYTDMELDEISNPVGPGQMLRLSINADLFESDATEFPLPDGVYEAAASWYDFNPGTFNYGVMTTVQLPEGEMEVPDGSFFGDIAEGTIKFNPDFLSEGSFTVSSNAQGIYTITGIVIGKDCIKRKLKYVGELDVIDRSEELPVEIPNTNLTADIELTDLTQARLFDRGDSFWLQDQSYRNLELYLTASSVNLTQQWPKGSGNTMRLEFLVDWDTDVANGIPTGTYNMAPQHVSGGIDRVDIIPGNMVPGYPNKFELPTGSWYQKLSDNKLTNYARILGGSVTVTRDGDKHTFVVDVIDCDKTTPHHVKITYSQTTPITVYK